MIGSGNISSTKYEKQRIIPCLLFAEISMLRLRMESSFHLSSVLHSPVIAAASRTPSPLTASPKPWSAAARRPFPSTTAPPGSVLSCVPATRSITCPASTWAAAPLLSPARARSARYRYNCSPPSVLASSRLIACKITRTGRIPMPMRARTWRLRRIRRAVTTALDGKDI